MRKVSDELSENEIIEIFTTLIAYSQNANSNLVEQIIKSGSTPLIDGGIAENHGQKSKTGSVILESRESLLILIDRFINFSSHLGSRYLNTEKTDDVRKSSLVNSLRVSFPLISAISISNSSLWLLI